MNKKEVIEVILEKNENILVLLDELKNDREILENIVRDYEKNKDREKLELLVNEINRSKLITRLYYELCGNYVDEIANTAAYNITINE